MRIKKFTKKDSDGNTVSFEFDVPPMQEIPHPGEARGTDTVPAWLTPGEFVVNAEATRMFEPQIEKMNNMGREIQKAQGGTVPTYAAEGEIAKPLPRPNPPKNADPLDPQSIYSMLTNRGFSDIAAKGILGNMFQESKFDPDVYQRLDDNSTGKGRGLLQWETGGRFDTDPLNLVDFANKQEKSWRDPEVQLDFMIAEMDRSAGLTPESAKDQNYQYDMARSMMNQAQTPEEAAEVFSNLYLKPGKVHMDTRTAYASGFEPQTTQVAQADVPPVMQEVPKEEGGNFLGDIASSISSAIFGGNEEPSTEINMDLVYQDENKAAMQNAEKYLFMGDLVEAGGNLIDSIRQGPAEPTPEINVPDEYKVIEQLRQKGYTPEQVSAILRGEDVPVIQDPVEPIFKDVPQYTDQGAVGESMMGTKPGSLVSGMPEKGAPTVEVPEPAEVSVIPNSLKGLGYLGEGILDALKMSPSELLESTKDAAVGGPENRNVPEYGAVQIPDGPQADAYDAALLEDAAEDIKKVEEETIFGDVDRFDLQRASNTAATEAIKVNEAVEKQTELQNELDKQIQRGTVDPALVAAVEEQNKKAQEAETEALATIAGARKGDVKAAQEADDLVSQAKAAVDGAPEVKDDGKPKSKDDKKGKALSDLGGFKTLTNDQQKGFDQITKVKEEDIPQSFMQKANSTLKGIFGDLFDPQELARMGVIFAASQMMGYDSNAAIQYAAKGYLDRVDNKAVTKNAFAQSKEAMARFTPESLQDYVETGNFKSLVERPTPGVPMNPTGEMKTLYAKNGKGKVTVAVVKQGDKTLMVAKDGTVINPFNFHEEPSQVRGTDEYNKKVSDSAKTYTGYLDQLIESAGEGKEGFSGTGLNSGVSGEYIAKWQIENNIPRENMGVIVDMAYKAALASGEKVSDIRPYLESSMITATVGDSTLFTTKSGKPASSSKVLDAIDMGVALVKQNPASEGKTNDQIKNDLIAKFTTAYNDLGDDRQIYEDNALDDESGFLTFMLSEIEKAEGKKLGVY